MDPIGHVLLEVNEPVIEDTEKTDLSSILVQYVRAEKSITF